MENPSSPLDTLHQLKEMLDAGALTPTEFEALKQRLLFTAATSGPTAGASAAPSPVAARPVAEAEPAPATPALPATESAIAEETAAMLAEPMIVPLVAPVPALPPQVEPVDWHEEGPLESDHGPAKANSSLGLVLAIGAVLVFLAVVAYLGFTRPATDEHISSTSQTAADSLNTTIETGPQVAPLPTATAAPETVRVAPTNPAPALPSRAELEAKAAAARDSTAPAAAPTAADSAVRQ